MGHGEKTVRRLDGYTVGYALCGSFCTHGKSVEALSRIAAAGAQIVPIVSETVYMTDTRFGTAADLCARLAALCGRDVIHTIREAEPIGPESSLDLLIIAPCTGNTLAKLAHGITDTSVTMAAKAQLRADRPVLLAVSSNDALSANRANLAVMKRRPHVTLLKTFCDDPVKKPYSLVPRFDLLPRAAADLLLG